MRTSWEKHAPPLSTNHDFENGPQAFGRRRGEEPLDAIEKFEGDLPKITAFEASEFTPRIKNAKVE
ncbi:MAG: hypothetical protein ACI9W2_003121 [Gammaproteobacteria bacterium]|jgi:hypothetical protein